MQYRFFTGPLVWKIKKKLLDVACETKPDIVWFYNVQLISSDTVRRLRQILPDSVFCQFANDNPFSQSAKPGVWKNFLASIPYFDMHFAYRSSNINDYMQLGAKRIRMLRSYFIPEVDYPVDKNAIPERYLCDVVFAGHYEDDGRVEVLESICDAGFKLNLFGGGWNQALAKLRVDSPLRKKFPIVPATDEHYRFAICGAKVALCFLSTLNRDTYTRRSFQIPAMGTAMLSQYSEDLYSLFASDIETVFFHDAQEAVAKLKHMLENNQWRQSIATEGFAKVYSDGHDVRSRMKTWLLDVLSFQASIAKDIEKTY